MALVTAAAAWIVLFATAIPAQHVVTTSSRTMSDSSRSVLGKRRAGASFVVKGRTELSTVEALRSAEREAVRVVLAEFGPLWKRDASFVVPDDRVDEALAGWLESSLPRMRFLQRLPVEEHDTTAGLAYRQGFQLEMTGRERDRLMRRGRRQVASVNEHFYLRYGGIAALLILVVFGASRLDRMSQGWMTGRIRLAALLIAASGAWLMFP